MEKPHVYCVVGPTASGKTRFAIDLAKQKNGEVVSCDSMQIYRYMDIGTAKPDQEEMDGVVHHMLDFLEPTENYSVADFVKDAGVCIEDILSRGKTPVLCGGTGLYIDSLVSGMSFAEEARDDRLRAKLLHLAEEKGNEAVHNILRKEDPQAALQIHPNNVKRVIRAIEIVKTTGKTKAAFDKEARGKGQYDATWYGMALPREVLYERINRRVDIMMEKGLLLEVEMLLQKQVPQTATAMQAIGYKELVLYLEGKCTLLEATEAIKQESRRYAKRQITWFKRNPNIRWIDPLEGI